LRRCEPLPGLHPRLCNLMAARRDSRGPERTRKLCSCAGGSRGLVCGEDRRRAAQCAIESPRRLGTGYLDAVVAFRGGWVNALRKSHTGQESLNQGGGAVSRLK
jgi:hypothetical protein